jgi:hypothetical protein
LPRYSCLEEVVEVEEVPLEVEVAEVVDYESLTSETSDEFLVS